MSRPGPAIVLADQGRDAVSTLRALRVIASGLEAVDEAAESWAIAGFNAGDSDYRLIAMPNWPTALWESALDSTSFTVGFTVPAPADATLRWVVARL